MEHMCSSRLIDMKVLCQKGVRFGEARKMRKLIKNVLERAATASERRGDKVLFS